MASGGRERQQGSGWHTLIGLVVLLGIGVVLVLIVRALFSLLSSADSTVLAAVIVTSGTILVSVTSLILSNRQQQRQQTQQELRIRKAEVYEELLTYWFWVMRERKNTSEGKRKQRDEQYRATVPQKIITWGSEDVIREFTAQVGPGGETEETSMLGFEKLLFSIRKDLGHRDTTLKEGAPLPTHVEALRKALRGAEEMLLTYLRMASGASDHLP